MTFFFFDADADVAALGAVDGGLGSAPRTLNHRIVDSENQKAISTFSYLGGLDREAASILAEGGLVGAAGSTAGLESTGELTAA